MKLASLLLVLVGVLSLPACLSNPAPILVDQGPALAQSATSFGVQTGLFYAHATKAEALQIAQYVAEAKLLVATGEVPASALDAVANLLNSKITSPYVRSGIQAGIQLIRERLRVPTEGVLSPVAKIWVNAVLDGALSGCNLYAASVPAAGAVGAAPAAPSQISFR